MTIERILGPLRPTATRIYRIPILGYGARLIVAFIKLPRINFHLHRIDGEIRHLLETRIAPLERAPIAYEQLSAQLQDMDRSWRHNLPLFLNAVSSVGAFGHKLASVENGYGSIQDELMQLKEGIKTLVDEISEMRREPLKATGDEVLGSQIAHLSKREVELSNAIAQNVLSIDRLWERVELIRREFVYQAAAVIVADGASAYGERNNVRSTEVK